VSILQEAMTNNIIFPTKQLKVALKDMPYKTAEVKKISRLNMREYRKRGKSEKYVKVLSRFVTKLEKVANAHLKNNVRSVMES
jgi:protein associated with RNAse G/E